MPQLDWGAWFNQTSSVLLGFWLLVYLFFFVFLTQGTWLMKLRTKLTNLRSVVHQLFTQQALSLAQEVNGVTFMMTTYALSTALSTTHANVWPAEVTAGTGEILVETTDLAVELEALNSLDFSALVEESAEEEELDSEEDEAAVLALLSQVEVK